MLASRTRQHLLTTASSSIMHRLVTARSSSVLASTSSSMLRSSNIASSSSFLPLRSFSIFSSDAPGSDLTKMMRSRGDPTTAKEFLDAQVPLGAPKPSVLNKLRSSGRNSAEHLERRMNDAEEKLKKAMDYKAAKAEAKKKAAEEEAAAAAKAKKA